MAQPEIAGSPGPSARRAALLLRPAEGMVEVPGGLVDQNERAADRTTAPTRHFRPGMIWLLAWRNLVHDRVRFIATLVGIAFSVVLMAVQLGLLLGSADTAAGLINHAGADLWVAQRGTQNVDNGLPLPDRWRYRT